MNSGKKAIGAGPGNPPAVVDETANLAKAADAIVRGASLDNNIVCIAEKEVIAVDSDRRRAHRASCKRQPVLLLDAPPGQASSRRSCSRATTSTRTWVGKDAGVIAKAIGIGGHGHDLRLLMCEVDEQHPFVQHELLMPVIPLFRVRDAADGIAAALRVEHGFHHTATMHSTQHRQHGGDGAGLQLLDLRQERRVVRRASALGGEGYTSFTIASPTGEGLTTAVHFTRERRCTLKEAFRFV